MDIVGAAEVNQARLDQFMTPARQTDKLEPVVDYRKILDRKDVDAVKSPEKPAAHMEIGYHSALPCLLALESRQKGKAIGRDANARASKVL